MRIAILIKQIISALAALVLASMLTSHPAAAQNIVVLVNDEPITSFDVTQRQRWLARTSGFGERMKALLTGDSVNQRFRQLMMAAQPHSQAEAQQAAERIKKQLIEDAKRRVLAEGGGSSRKIVIDALIEDKLKLQAAKKLEIKITDKEVEENLLARATAAMPNAPAPSQNAPADTDAKPTEKAHRGHRAAKSETPDANANATPGETKKRPLDPRLEAFYAQFENDGINRRTINEIVRAQLAWRDVIRKKFGQRIAAIVVDIPAAKTAEGDIQFDVRVLRLAVSDTADQRAVGERMLEAENLKEKFRSCAELPKEAQLVSGATVKSIDKAKLVAFPKDIQPLIEKVNEGQMTPPVLVGNAVESYAVCRKSVIMKPNAQAEQKVDPRQAEFERFARSFLQEIKASASIDYRGS